jgi:hypothetical protein
MWTGISKDCLIGPYIFRERLLESRILTCGSTKRCSNTFTAAKRVNAAPKKGWIGHGSKVSVSWTARSPHSNPLDFSPRPCGVFESQGLYQYIRYYRGIQRLPTEIKNMPSNIPMFANTAKLCVSRYGGYHFKHLAHESKEQNRFYCLFRSCI